MPDEKWSPLLPENRPEFAIDGADNLLFSQELISLIATEKNHGVQQCEAIVNNWGTLGNKIDYLFSESDAFEVGKAFEVKAQNSTFFEGFISGLKGEYVEGGPPRLIVGAKAMLRELGKPRLPLSRNTKPIVHPRENIWGLDMYGSLREIAISVESIKNNSKGRPWPKRFKFAGHGVARLNAALHMHDHITINGLGSRFSGDYSVTSVNHLWDRMKGNRTEFTIERPI